MALSSWSDFRAERAVAVPMDDAARDLVLAGHMAGRDTIESAVLRGQIPIEAAELIASATGYAGLARRALAMGDETTAHAHISAAEVLAVRANDVRTEAVKRRFAELKRRHLEERGENSETGKRALAAAAGRKNHGYADALREAQRRKVARAERQHLRDEQVREAWSGLLSKVDLPIRGGTA